MEKLSSGFRINRAADNPAGLVISEQFRAQIAGMNQAIENSEGSINMIQTADGALTEINSLLVSMRELAIHAANEGFNDDAQLAADQAEIENAMRTIDRIASNTEFGTKKLLDGSKDNIATITSANTSGLNIVTSGLKTGVHSISATKTADASASLNTDSLGLSLVSNGSPVKLSEGIHKVDVLQSSDVAKKSSGSFSMADAFGNNLTLAAAAAVATLESAAAVGATATASHAGTYNVVLNSQEHGESTTGDQTLSVNITDGMTSAQVAAAFDTAIAQNSALAGKVDASITGGKLRFATANSGAQYSVKYTTSSDTASVSYFTMGSTRSARGVSDNELNFTVTTATNSGVTSNVTVAAGAYTSHATLVTAINTALDTAFGKVQGDNAVSDMIATVSGNNSDQLQFATQDEGGDYKIKLNAFGGDTGDLENVLNMSADTVALSGTNALVSFDNFTNTLTSVKYAGVNNDVTLQNKASSSSTMGTITMSVSNAQTGINVGNLLLDVTAAKFDVRVDAGPATAVTAGKETVVFNADRSESLKISYDLDSTGGTETINNTDQSLVFQIGGSVGQTTAIGLRGMSASSLGRNVADNIYTSLSEIDVTTVDGAVNAQSIIDSSINEVSTSRGALGSFQKNTLESNLRNLRIAAQNLTAAESNIRDTDMAKEMSEFTKNQILMQAGTSMLAQANQIPQVVLSLFR
jgi:flagellin